MNKLQEKTVQSIAPTERNAYTETLHLQRNISYYFHNTRISQNFHLQKVNHCFAKKYIISSLPFFLNGTISYASDKVHSYIGDQYFSVHTSISRFSRDYHSSDPRAQCFTVFSY